jgi:iron-sulfur cluster repair protein YtfE (RIC family)
MSSTDNINNMAAKLAQEHKIITDYIAKLTEKLKTNDKEFFSELSAFISLLEKDLFQHFEMEEKVFFPAAIMGAAAYESTLMIMQFQKDHGALEKQLQWLIETSKTSGINSAAMGAVVIESLKDFFTRLKIHVKREMIELFPMINENPRSRSLLKSYAEEFKNRLSGEPEPF